MSNKQESIPLKMQSYTIAIVKAATIERRLMGLDNTVPSAEECRLLQERIIWGIKDFQENPCD